MKEQLERIAKEVISEETVESAELTFLASAIYSELSGLKTKKAKEVGNKIYQALLALRDGNDSKAKSIFKKI